MTDLVFTKEQWEADDFDSWDIIEALIWRDEPDLSHRWEEFHSGVFEWEGKYYWAKWVEGKTEMQESTWFEEYYMNPDGSISFPEAEQYEVVETKWRVKNG